MNMVDIEKFLKKLKWKIHARLYGSHHSSTIGFITSEWLKKSEQNEVFDGAPKIKSKKSRKHADLLMCQHGKLAIVGEVEADVSNYGKKTEAILDYWKEYKNLRFGILVMMNCNNCGKKIFGHFWEKNKAKWKRLRGKIERSVKKANKVFVVVAIERKRTEECKRGHDSDTTKLRRIVKRNQYLSGDAVSIDYWIFKRRGASSGNLWKGTA